MKKNEYLKLIIIPMLPTLYGRRYQIAKYLSLENEVHLINWTMPYPVNYKNLKSSLLNSWRSKKWEQDGIIVHKIWRFPFFLPPINRFFFQKQIRSIFNEIGADAIISQSFFNETEPPADLPMFFDYNDDYSSFARIYGSSAYKFAYRFLQVDRTVRRQQQRAKAIFAVSNILEKKAKDNNKHVYKIPNGVDSDLIKGINTRKKQLRYGNYSLVYVSTFGKWSKILSIIKVIDELKNQIPDIKLLLVGDGTELQSAKELIDKLGLDSHIILTGHISNRRKLFELINDCAVCLNISEKNAFRDAASPIKVFEYTALRKIVVSTNLNEVVCLNLPNVITYTDSADHYHLKMAITEAFKRVQNNAVRIPEEIIQEYSWKTLAKKIANILRAEGIT